MIRVPQLIRVALDSVTLACWDWPGEEPAVVFAHGTGFHGRCWDQLIHHLPNRRSLAIDARGHGRSGKPEPPYHLNIFGRDLAEAAAQLGISRAIGVGHSMGGHSITAAAARRPETFAALLLLDPVILNPERYSAPPPDTAGIRRRRDRWPSPEAMFANFRERPPFARWQPQVLRDYCDYALLPADGEYRLACPPHVEAAIFDGVNKPEADLHPVIPSISCPVTVLRAGASAGTFPGSRPSPTDPQLAACFPNGQDVCLPAYSHFIPMEAPELVADYISGMMAGAG